MDGKKANKKKQAQLPELSAKSPPISEVAQKTPNRAHGRIAKRKLHQGGENEEVPIGNSEDKPPSTKKKRTRSSSTSCISSPTNLLKPALTERQQLALILQMTDPQKQQQQQPQQSVASPSVESSPRDTPGRNKVHKRNERGETPLHLACIKGDTAGMVNLLELGADINTTDHAGWTPLHEACNHGHINAVILLIDRGAKVNAAGMGGETPLHDAVINNHIEVVKVLLSRGADPQIKNSHKQTPLDICREDTIHSMLKNALSRIPHTDQTNKGVFSPPEKKLYKSSFLQTHTPPPSHSRTMSLRREFVRRAETPPPRLHSQSRLVHIQGRRGKVNSRGSFYSDFSSSESDSDTIDHIGHSFRFKRIRNIQPEVLHTPESKEPPNTAAVSGEGDEQQVQSGEKTVGEDKEKGKEEVTEQEKLKENSNFEEMDIDEPVPPTSPPMSEGFSGLAESSQDLKDEPVDVGGNDSMTEWEESCQELMLVVSLPLNLLNSKVKQESCEVTNGAESSVIPPNNNQQDSSHSPSADEKQHDPHITCEMEEKKSKDSLISSSPKSVSPVPGATLISPVSDTKSPLSSPHASVSPIVTRSVSIMSGETRRVSSIEGDEDTCSSFPNKETTPTSIARDSRNSNGDEEDNDDDDDDSRSTVVSFSTSLPIIFGSIPPSNLCSSSVHSDIPKRTRSLSPSLLPIKGSGSGPATPIQSRLSPVVSGISNLENDAAQQRIDTEVCGGVEEDIKPPSPKAAKNFPSDQNQASGLEMNKKIEKEDFNGPSSNTRQTQPPKRRISRQVFRSCVINQRRSHLLSNPPASPGPAPHNYDTFLTSRCSYRSRSLPHPRDPKDVYPPLTPSQYKLFTEQEQERMALLASHLNEVDRLVVCFEQELIRAHQKASSILYPPLNVCAVLIERFQHQVFSLPSLQDQQLLSSNREGDNSKESSTRDTSPLGADDHLLNSYVQDVWDKYHRCSELLASRHKMEVEALWLTQKQQWRERNTDVVSSYLPSHVPVAHTGTFPSYVR